MVMMTSKRKTRLNCAQTPAEFAEYLRTERGYHNARLVEELTSLYTEFLQQGRPCPCGLNFR